MDELNNSADFLLQNDDFSSKILMPETIANSLVATYNPRTVLFSGDGAASLVVALRAIHIEAYGILFSSSAFMQADEAVRSFLFVADSKEISLPHDFPTHFDLSVCFFSKEAPSDEDFQAFLAKYCLLSNHILFSCPPQKPISSANEPIQAHWVKHFAQHGFYRTNTNMVPKALPHAQYFSKRDTLSPSRLVEDYEHHLRLIQHDAMYHPRAFYASAVFGFNGTFDEENAILHLQTNSQLDWHFTVPKKATQVRLAFALENEAVSCDVCVTANNIPLPVTSQNGTHPKPGDFLYTSLKEPSFLLSLPPCASEITVHVTANTYLFTKENPLACLLQNEQLRTFDVRSNFRKQSQITRAEIVSMQKKVANLQVEFDQLQSDFERDEWLGKENKARYKEISNAPTWKLTAPFRFASAGFINTVRSACLAIPPLAPRYTYHAACRSLGKEAVDFYLAHYGTLDGCTSPFAPSVAEGKAQEAHLFQTPLTFSIVCPLYNTPKKYLVEMLYSVLGQTYPHWELCLADGSDEEHAYVKSIVQTFANKDKQNRIKYVKLRKNGGIVQNTNAAIEMANGDFIALLDHDDILNINALFCMRMAIEKTGADVAYSDEYTFQNDDLSQLQHINFKPDYSPDTLRSNNYICHFLVFNKHLLSEVGGALRQGFEGSQDYDLVLRLSEKARYIAHVPEILYFWRSHANSVASDISAKPYTLMAAQKALTAHLQRCQLLGSISILLPLGVGYKTDYRLQGTPLVSILIENCDDSSTLHACVRSILQKSTYTNLEILLLDNESENPATFALYETLQKDKRIRIFKYAKKTSPMALYNEGAALAQGDFLLFLSGKSKIVKENWLEEMLMFAQRSDVGVTGTKIYTLDDKLVHAGLVLGDEPPVSYSYLGFNRHIHGYVGNLILVHNVSAISAGCFLVRRSLFEEENGFNTTFSSPLCEADFCLRLRRRGLFHVFTPFAELLWLENFSDSAHEGTFAQESQTQLALFKEQYQKELQNGDPYLNHHLDSSFQFLGLSKEEPSA